MARENLRIDKRDTEILKALLENARISLRELSERTKLPESELLFRLRKLREMGVIGGTILVLDPRRIGFGSLSIAILEVDPSKEEELKNKLLSMPFVVSLYSILGKGKLMAAILARSLRELSDVISNIMRMDGVVNVESYVLMEAYEPMVFRKIPLELVEVGG